ncbi:MAG: flagellar biosynthesis anti-sigma factor FlgM [Gammaproteobacteria bacterium]|nr:flagellar biosynthesis anti-sigma factor FlgM [Gammaproteobacteria bacterium]
MSIDITGLPNNKTTNERSSAVKKDSANSAASNTEKSETTSADTVSLTGTAEKLRKLEAALSELPVADEDRIEGIKRAVANGTYEIDAQRIADKMLDFERSLNS